MKKEFLNSTDKDLLADLHKLKDELQLLKEELRANRSEDHPDQDHLRAEKNIRFLISELFSGTEESPGLIRRSGEIPSIETHYGRNQLMPVSTLPQKVETAIRLGWDDSVGAACHQFTSPDRSNVKYVSPDGHKEVIFNRSGHIVTASEDYGTYNFADSRQDPVGHFYRDVLPWLLWGNDRTDSTDMHQRLKALVVYGGIESTHSRMEKKTERTRYPEY